MTVTPIKIEVSEVCPGCGLRADLQHSEVGDVLTHACGARLVVCGRFLDEAWTRLRVWLAHLERVKGARA